MSFRRFVGLRISTTAGAVPTASDMAEGELAFNVADGKVFTLFGSTVADITDRYTVAEIDSLLDGKAAATHTHPWSNVTGKPATATRWPTFAEVTDKPATYPPSSHSHSQYVQKEVGKGLSTEDYTTADRDKLAGIEAGATADQTKADIDSLGVDADTVDGKHANDFDPAGSAQSAQDHAVQRSNHTGTQPADTITETASLKLMTSAERNKLAAVGTLANRDVYISDQPPDNQVGQDGDIWLQHWS